LGGAFSPTGCGSSLTSGVSLPSSIRNMPSKATLTLTDPPRFAFRLTAIKNTALRTIRTKRDTVAVAIHGVCVPIPRLSYLVCRATTARLLPRMPSNPRDGLLGWELASKRTRFPMPSDPCPSSRSGLPGGVIINWVSLQSPLCSLPGESYRAVPVSLADYPAVYN
jgi:hypothetical protein